jgi:hypothetical protein
MKHPDWYARWRHEAVHQLQAMNARLNAEFRLGAWSRYDYDFDEAKITFSDRGVAKVIAEIQIAGSTSGRAGNWLWAWANSNLPPALVKDASLARAFGEQHGICELTDEVVSDDDINALGWKLTSLAVRIGNAIGAYRPPRDEGGGIYLTYKSIGWAS